YRGLEIKQIPQLEPGVSPEAVTAWLREIETSGAVALVGHEPALSALATYLLTAHDPADRSILELEKGGACLVEVPAGVPPGEARLVWLATARQLRRIGRK